jgi:hypothetical protein
MNAKRLFLALLIALATLPALAQTLDPPLGTVITNPRVPYAGQPISVIFNDVCAGPTSNPVQRNGNFIRVNISRAPCNPPVTNRLEIPIGTLAAGMYQVGVYLPGNDLVAATEFQVLAVGEQPFFVRPAAVPSGVTNAPLQVLLESNYMYAPCQTPDCTVRVGGVVAQKTLTESSEQIWITPPPLPPGVYDVTIENAAFTLTAPGSLHYFDRNAAPDPLHFERILFPVLFNAPGANGSLWRTEAVISNPEPGYLETYNDISTIVCIAYPCGERIAPASKLRFDGGNYPRGVALIVPRRDADSLTFALRVRDVSRVAESYGTEIPVVREADMFKDTAITLLDVPVDPRYRVRVRVYAFDAVAGATGTVNGHDSMNRSVLVQPFALTRNCNGVRECAAVPWSAELDLVAGAQGERRNLYVHVPAGTTAWAFATVTNNKTQEVTIVRPSGTGGEPCLPCLTP